MSLLAAALLLTGVATQEPTSAQTIYKRALPSIATLNVKRSDGSTGTGTAFLAIRDGLAVTAWHVVNKAQSVTAKFADGEEFEVSGVTDKDEKRDLAVIRIKVSGRPLLSLAAKEPEVGSKAFLIGAPRGLEFSISDGIVSQLRASEQGRLIQFTCPASPGNSGGPLLNEAGEVSAVVSFQVTDGQNLNFGVPVAYVRGLDASLATTPWAAVKSTTEAPGRPGESPDTPEVPESVTARKLLDVRIEAERYLDAICELRAEVSRGKTEEMQIPYSFIQATEGYARLAKELRTLRPKDEAALRATKEAAVYYSSMVDTLESIARTVQEAREQGAWSQTLIENLQRAWVRMDAGERLWDESEAYFRDNVAKEDLKAYHPDLLASVIDFKNMPFGAIRFIGIRPEVRKIPTIVVSMVIQGSIAERAKLQAGDTILTAADAPIEDLAKFQSVLVVNWGRKLQLGIKRRNGKPAKVTLDLKGG